MQLTANALTKCFGEKQVLKGVSFTAKSGSALGLLGRNGAGKTTTIRIVMQVFLPDSGNVTLDGRTLDTRAVRIGYLPEERGLYPKKQILEQLIYFGELRGMRASEAKKSAMRLLERLQMGEYAAKRLDTLSKGNQQKIQLAATLLNDPEIVILDEPFSGLDPVNAMLLKDIVHELIQHDKIVLFSSHQMNYIEEFCDDIAILKGGDIVLDGSIREIKRSYDRSRIVLSGPDMGALRRLAEQAGEIVSSVSEKNGGLLVQLRSVEDKAGLLRLLAAQGVEFDEFRVYEPSLNDIFVEYTEDGI